VARVRTLWLVILVGCGGPAAQFPDASVEDAGLSDGGVGDAGPADAGAERDIPIRAVRDTLGLSRIYCLAQTLDDAGVALLVDTGSQVSFLSLPAGSPDYVPDAGALYLGGTLRPLAGRPYSSNESIDGRPVVGTLGTDFMIESPTELDTSAQLIRKGGPWDAGGWTALPYENTKGYLYVRVSIDTRAVRIGFDTGSPDTLLIDAGHAPTDQQVQTQDAYGNTVTFWLGTGALAWPGEAASTVPVLRTESFPSFEDSNKLVGGEIDGLFGLTSWPAPRLRFEPASSTLYFSP
jgi:hypothetical protein